MAINYNDVNATVRESFLPVVVDNFFQQIVLFYRLLKKGRVTALYGRDLTNQPIILDGYTVRNHDNKYEKVAIEVKDVLGTAKLGYAHKYDTININRYEEQRFSSRDAIVNALKVRIQVAKNSLVQQVESVLYSQETVDSKYVPIDSLDKIIDNGVAYPTYAGISRADVLLWKSPMLDKAGGSITYSDLSNIMQAVTYNTEKPTLIVTSPGLWTKINTLIYDKFHYHPTKDDDLYNLGIDNYRIFGAPVISSQNCPTGKMLFINENYLELFVDKEADENGLTFEDFKEVELTRKLKYASFWFDGQLYSPSPRMHAKIINASEA